MFNRLKNLLVPPETKASRAAKVVAFESGGRARWTPRDYAALAREGYLANAIVHRAVRLIAENVASCSYLVFDGAQERDAHPLTQLLTRPNARQDGAAFFEMLVSYLLLSGNAYVEAVTLDGAVRELYALRPDRMKVVPGPDGWAEAYEYGVAGRSVRFDQTASAVPPILHLTFFHPLDDHYGLAPIEPAAIAIDAAIQVSVLDVTRTAPPSSPADGERHVVATGATGVWAGQGNAIATWQDGAWAFLPPKTGWCVWSVADDIMFVFDATAWRNFHSLPAAIDNASRVGINTGASSPNLLTVKSNAALFTAIDAADGGTGDARVQVSKETVSNTASVFFSDNFSGRAEFGLVGSDAFKLKVSPDGSAWTDAFNIDQGSGNLTLPRGLALTGVIAPAQITTNQNDYNPTGIAAASVLQINADAARSISGLAGGTDGRCVTIINVGIQPVTLLNESTSSSASNRFTLSGNLTISAKQSAILRYDGTAARWQAMAGGAALVPANNLSDLNSAATALTNLGGTTVGVSVFKATDAAAAQAAIGLPNGISIQTVSASSNTSASGTTTFAFGDNVPTITEGTEILTCAITPKYSTSKLRIDYNIRIAGTGGTTVGVALFQDTVSAALDAEQVSIVNADNGTTLCGVYFMTAGTTSSTTFRLRAGCAGGTWYVNSTSAGRRFGGVLTTTLSITEIKG